MTFPTNRTPEKESAMVHNIMSKNQQTTTKQTVYERYLHTDELLSLQTPVERLVHHDELQFQVVHQVFELWWKETAFELGSIRTLLQQYNVPAALRLMQRVIRIQ